MLLCQGSLQYADERRYGAAGNWNLQQGQMYAPVGRLGEYWGSFADIRSPIFGSPLTAFWTRGFDEDGHCRWFRWTRVTTAPTISFTHEVTGVDLAYRCSWRSLRTVRARRRS